MLAFPRVFHATAARGALARFSALATALAVLGGIVLGGNGIHPADVVAWASASFAFRLALLATASLCSLLVLGDALRAAGTGSLRALPIAPWQTTVATAVLASLGALPFAVLLALGGAAGLSASFLVIAGALALALSSRARAGDRRVTPWVLASSAALLLGAPRWGVLPLGALALHGAARHAWAHALERPSSTLTVPLARLPATLALAVVHGLGLAREGPALLIRGVALALGAGLAAGVVLENRDPTASVEAVVLGMVSLPIAATLPAVVARMLEEARRLRWMLDATATPRWKRRAAQALHGGTVGATLGTLTASSSLLGRVASAPWPRVASGALWGATLGVAYVALGSRLMDARAEERARLARGALALLVVAVVLGATLGLSGAVIVLVGSGLALARRLPREARR